MKEKKIAESQRVFLQPPRFDRKIVFKDYDFFFFIYLSVHFDSVLVIFFFIIIFPFHLFLL